MSVVVCMVLGVVKVVCGMILGVVKVFIFFNCVFKMWFSKNFLLYRVIENCSFILEDIRVIKSRWMGIIVNDVIFVIVGGVLWKYL